MNTLAFIHYYDEQLQELENEIKGFNLDSSLVFTNQFVLFYPRFVKIYELALKMVNALKRYHYEPQIILDNQKLDHVIIPSLNELVQNESVIIKFLNKVHLLGDLIEEYRKEAIESRSLQLEFMSLLLNNPSLIDDKRQDVLPNTQYHESDHESLIKVPPIIRKEPPKQKPLKVQPKRVKKYDTRGVSFIRPGFLL